MDLFKKEPDGLPCASSAPFLLMKRKRNIKDNDGPAGRGKLQGNLKHVNKLATSKQSQPQNEGRWRTELVLWWLA